MSIPQPKILSPVTVPTGGWEIRVVVSSGSSLNTNIDFNIAAGTYFISGDNQSDDLLYEFRTKFDAAILTSLGADSTVGGVILYIDSNHKVNIAFTGTRYTSTNAPVRISWSLSDGPSMAAALGFDAANIDSSANYPIFTANWHHAYGWYSDDDGLLENMPVEDASEAMVMQAVAHSGRIVTQMFSERWSNKLRLNWLPRSKTFSGGVAYGEVNVYPYERNEGLECWWESAKLGNHFRVYRNACMLTARAPLFTISSGTTTTVTVSGVTLDTDPYRWKNGIIYVPAWVATRSAPQSFYIASHDSTVLTVSNAGPNGLSFGNSGAYTTFYLMDHQYETYVVDLNDMNSFQPSEITRQGLWSLDIPLLRYV